jgi:isochorismate synthase
MTSHSALVGFHEYCLSKDLPFVTYRLPNENTPVTIISNSRIIELPGVDDELMHDAFFSNGNQRQGFLMAPFMKDRIRLWMNADQVFYGEDFSLFDQNAIQPEVFKQHNAADDFLPEQTVKSEYLGKTKSLLKAIHEGEINKAVLSRPVLVEFNKLEESHLLFERVLKSLPSAFVYFLSIPGAGTWLGATPELLLKASFDAQSTDAKIETMALAGTRKAGVISEWGIKEIDEQQCVANDIKQKLTQAGCTNIEQSKTYTAIAGNIEHLRTDFTAQINSDLIMKLAGELHPTPAICGWPTDKALSLILSTEKYERTFYSGYLGPVNMNQMTSLFVNLRCMKISAQSAALFVGGGITSASDPELEWEETRIKSRTLLAEIEKIRNLAS